MFKIFLLIALPVLAVAWIIYGIFHYKMVKEEKSKPRPSSERLQKTRSELSDWAKKMSEYKKPTYKRPDQQQNKQDSNS